MAAELLGHREWPSLESLCRHYKTCSLDQNPSVYLHKLLLVNVSSAIVIAVGFLLSTSPTDVLSIITGGGSGITLIGMPWTPLLPSCPLQALLCPYDSSSLERYLLSR